MYWRSLPGVAMPLVRNKAARRLARSGSLRSSCSGGSFRAFRRRSTGSCEMRSSARSSAEWTTKIPQAKKAEARTMRANSGFRFMGLSLIEGSALDLLPLYPCYMVSLSVTTHEAKLSRVHQQTGVGQSEIG